MFLASGLIIFGVEAVGIKAQDVFEYKKKCRWIANWSACLTILFVFMVIMIWFLLYSGKQWNRKKDNSQLGGKCF